MATGQKKKRKNRLYDRHHMRVFSRHPSHRSLRMKVPTGGTRTLLRLGSSTTSNWPSIEINTVDAIKNSSNKIKMKKLFHQAGVPSPDFVIVENGSFTYYRTGNRPETGLTADQVIDKFRRERRGISSVIRKKCFRSRGNGMIKIDTITELRAQLRNALNYAGDNPRYFEKYSNFTREYRLHINGVHNRCFYTCRKMLKEDTPENKRWFRNDSNCVWYLPDNPNFNRPNTWVNIVSSCTTAMEAVGLDIGAFDVKVASDGRHYVLEVNSAPSFGDITLQKYIEELPTIINEKNRNNVRNFRV